MTTIDILKKTRAARGGLASRSTVSVMSRGLLDRNSIVTSY